MSNHLAIELKVNGERRRTVVRVSDTLLIVLREYLGLTGAKPGCENGDCGTCTIILDGLPMKSCLMLAVEAVDRDVLTIEGLRDSPVQHAFMDKWAFQCGYCTPGFIMNCHALAVRKPDADDRTIENWLQSNICRCTSYQEIKEAVRAVLASSKNEEHKGRP